MTDVAVEHRGCTAAQYRELQ